MIYDKKFDITTEDQITGIHAITSKTNKTVEISVLDDVMDHTLSLSLNEGIQWNQDNNVLWCGAPRFMTDTQEIQLSQPISNQLTGAVLVWSRYDNNKKVAKDDSWYYQFVPKWHVLNNGYTGVYVSMPNGITSAEVCNKYLYVDDTTITGHKSNVAKGTGYANNTRVLRAVLGV